MAQGTTKGVPIDIDPLLAADSDLLVPSQKAIKTYTDTGLSGKVNRSGDSMSGSLLLVANPTAPLEAATKDYVDTLINGIDWKQAANAATVAALPTYNVTGSGQILTGTVNGAIPSATTDGVTLTANQRLLVKNETSTRTPNNGIYVVTQVGSGSLPFILTRSSDANTSALLAEATLSVAAGSTLANTQWHCNPAAIPLVIGTTNITFAQIGTGVYSFSAPLVDTGGVISIPAATTSVDGYLSSTDWTNFNTAYTNRITSLTTTGSSGSSTLISNVLNVPTYTLSGLGGQPLATNLTSLSGLTYASTSFVKMTAAGTFALDTNSYQGALTLTTTGTSGASTLIGNTLNIPQYAGATVGGVSGNIQYNNGTTFAGSNNLFWDSTFKYLGIGTNFPGYLVDAQGNVNSDQGIQIRNNNSGSFATTGILLTNDGSGYLETMLNSSTYSGGARFGINAEAVTIAGSVITVLGTVNTSALIFGTNNSERIRIFGSTGNVGVNTATDAGYKLDVNGTTRLNSQSLVNFAPSNTTDNVFKITNTRTGSGTGFEPACLALDNTATANTIPCDIRLGSSNPAGIRIYASSTVLTATPTGAGLQFYTNASSLPGQVYFDSGANNSASLVFRTAITSGSITERMRIFAGGNVGINVNNTDAGFRLDVNGTGRFQNTLTGTIGSFSTLVGGTQIISGSGYTAAIQYRTTNAGAGITPEYITNSGSNTAGLLGVSIDRTNSLIFTANNGSANIARAGINITNLTNTAGAESGDMIFSTQSGGTAMTEKMRLTSGGRLGLGINSPNTICQINLTNTDFTNTNGAGSHIYMTNPSATGQNVVSSFIGGVLVAKWRTDFVGNISWVAGSGGAHDFYTGGDFSVGSIKMRIFNGGNVQIATSPVGGANADAGFKLDVQGTARIQNKLTLGNSIIASGSSEGTSGQVLTSNGVGATPSWTTVSGGGGLPWQFTSWGLLGGTTKSLNFLLNDIGLLGSNTGNPVNARLLLLGQYVPQSSTISGVRMVQNFVGNYTGTGFNGVGLYSYSAGTLTLVASSTNDSAPFKVASGWRNFAFTSTYSATPGIYYAAVLISWSSIVSVANFFGRDNSGVATNAYNMDFTNNAKAAGYIDSQTSLPASINMSSVVTLFTPNWASWLY